MYFPFGVVFFLIALYILAGVDMLPGVVLTFAISLLGPVCGKYSRKTKLKAAAVTDKRLNMIYDTIEGMRVIKTQCWEKEMEVSLPLSRK